MEHLREIGIDMRPFNTEKHIRLWAGLCPGNNKSAEKQNAHLLRKAILISKVYFVKLPG